MKIEKYISDYNRKIIQQNQPITSVKIGRNDPCPCGSGKKYKKCCLPQHEAEEQLMQSLNEPETLSDKYMTVQEYTAEVGYPVVNFDFLLLELLNIVGSMLHKYRKPAPENIKEILKNRYYSAVHKRDDTVLT